MKLPIIKIFKIISISEKIRKLKYYNTFIKIANMDILPQELIQDIEDIVFDPKKCTSVEKIKLSLVSKNKFDIYTEDTDYKKICQIYDELKNTKTISKKNAKFIEKKIDMFVQNEMDEYNDEENEFVFFDIYSVSENYKNYCFNLTINFAYNKLYVLYLVLNLKEVKKTINKKTYIFEEESEVYQANAVEIYNKLLMHDKEGDFPDINNLTEYIEFVKNLSMTQKIYSGL